LLELLPQAAFPSPKATKRQSLPRRKVEEAIFATCALSPEIKLSVAAGRGFRFARAQANPFR
jgi:hypothetical protein